MQNNGPLVSVILCFFNAEKYLENCLKSLIQQSYSNFEIIALNDGSTDQSPLIIEKHAKNEPRIKLYHQKNAGLTISLNRAIQKAKGKYLARQDADDLSLHKRLEKQVSFLEENHDHFLVGTHFFNCDENYQNLKEPNFIHFPTENHEIRKILPFYNCFCHTSVMFRNKPKLIQGFYDPSFTYTQDYELWIRIAKNHKLANLRETLVYRMEQENAISSKKYKIQRYHAIRAKLKSLSLTPPLLPFLSNLCKDTAVAFLPKSALALLKKLMK